MNYLLFIFKLRNRLQQYESYFKDTRSGKRQKAAHMTSHFILHFLHFSCSHSKVDQRFSCSQSKVDQQKAGCFIMQSLVSFMELLPLVAFHCFSCHFSFPYPTENLLDRKERVSECLLINCTGSPPRGSIWHLVVSQEWMIYKIYTKRKKTQAFN